MPKSRRDILKRQVGHAYANTKRAAEHLISVQAEFEAVHPEHSQYLALMILNLSYVNDWIKDFWIKTWGHFPEDIEGWRNTGQSYRNNQDE